MSVIEIPIPKMKDNYIYTIGFFIRAYKNTN